ncbi:MAG: ABC transporter substrate-binding protein [Sphaerochaetaceae bacterium]|jgi:hypothetical protein|nr:ABC transporter substrate-binding protein [Sphaerochaetaceae bacterium]NLY07899.1 ABC transporter substrate-binding protein [Spirochaetales bacterium]
MFKKKMMLALVLCTALVLCAQPVAEISNGVVASTSWVAAIAQLAGVDGCVTIAPADMKHPPEYEITASDMVLVTGADLFIYAGYERMMDSIKNAAGLNGDRFLKIVTKNSVSVLKSQVIAISKRMGTEAEGAERLKGYVQMIEEARAFVRENGLDEIPCYVNVNQIPLAEDIGLKISGSFGPGPLSAEQFADVARNRYPLIIDNIHNPVSNPLASVSSGSIFLTWRNFPEKIEKDALIGVVSGNLNQLVSIFK